MSVYFSELAWIGGDPVENVDRMIGAGAQNIELMLDGPGWDRFDLRMDSLAAALRKRPVGYSVHTPVWDTNLTSENFFVRQGVMESLRQSIVFAAKIGATHVVIHPGFVQSPAFSKAAARRRAEESIRQLLRFNRDYGQRLLIENVGSAAHSLFTQREFAEFLNGFPEEAGYLIDTGHAHMNHWDIPELIHAVQDRLYALHIHDNNGKGDQHRPIGEGTTDWESIVDAVRQTERPISLVLEYDVGTDPARLTQGQEQLGQWFSF